MNQMQINTDAFANLTVHRMLLKQLTLALFSQQQDNGDLFIEQFLHQLRYKLRVPQSYDADSGIDPQQLQEAALIEATRFFDSIRNPEHKKT